MSQTSAALATFELENNVQLTDENDAIFRYDADAQRTVNQQRPWHQNPHYFKHVKVSAMALVKMTMHCKSGGNMEVMGMMMGKTVGDTFVVLDSFALPVEGTETRVNAASEANEYMVQFLESSREVGRQENILGWYHSHPGYGCWMSGIDCTTQMLNQQFQEPFLAIIIDPVRTCAAGKVEIGAFRTYPEGYTTPAEAPGEYQTIPLNKIEDFGVHANQYYSLDVSFFKSSLDSHVLNLLWGRYWVNTLSSSPLAWNREFISGQVADIAEKLEQVESHVSHSGPMGGFMLPVDRKKEDGQLHKISRDAAKAAIEQAKGMSSQLIKDLLFNFRPIVGAAPTQDVQMADAA